MKLMENEVHTFTYLLPNIISANMFKHVNSTVYIFNAIYHVQFIQICNIIVKK